MPVHWLSWQQCGLTGTFSPYRFQAGFWIFFSFCTKSIWSHRNVTSRVGDWVCMCPFTCAPRQPIYTLEWSGLGPRGITRCWGEGHWSIRKACVNHKLILKAHTHTHILHLLPHPLLVAFDLIFQYKNANLLKHIALLRLDNRKSNTIVPVQHLCKAVLATQSAVVHAQLKIYTWTRLAWLSTWYQWNVFIPVLIPST